MTQIGFAKTVRGPRATTPSMRVWVGHDGGVGPDAVEKGTIVAKRDDDLLPEAGQFSVLIDDWSAIPITFDVAQFQDEVDDADAPTLTPGQWCFYPVEPWSSVTP